MERREEEAEDGERVIQSKEDEGIDNLLELIPLDLIPDILLRLPAKSAARFRCVSKLWSSITTRPDFIMSFAFRSSTRLHLLVCFTSSYNKRFFISLPQHEHPDTSYSDVDRYQIDPPQFYLNTYKPCSESVHGLICCAGFMGDAVVSNPTMRQHVTLPEPELAKVWFKSYFLGYDPVEDKHKVLCIPSLTNHDPLVFTLGPQESWRVTQNSPKHFRLPVGHEGLCINGHVYYEADIHFKVDAILQCEGILMSFDVRHEKFNIIRKPADPELCPMMLNYEGKFAWVCDVSSSLRFWVLEDEQKQEWSLRNFLLPIPIYPLLDPIWKTYLYLEGVTQDTGEFIYVETTFESIYVIYYEPKRNRTRRVIYEGPRCENLWESTGPRYENLWESKVHLYPNHSENLMSLENVPRARCVSPVEWGSHRLR